MKLIINADDLGFSKGINYGIYDAYKNGIVRSTTIMMNVPFTGHALELFKNEKIGIGVHLNVTFGKALVDTHKILADGDGYFRRELPEVDQGLLEEMEREFEAQIHRAYEMGVDVTHLDSHHHIHMSGEEIFRLSKRLASRYKLPMRCNRTYPHMTAELTEGITSTEHFSEDFYDETVSEEFLLQLIGSHISEETLEVMVHPGFLCDHLTAHDDYREKRMAESAILTSATVKRYIRDHDIELADFRRLR